MTNHGLRVWRKGQLIFTPTTNAARFIGSVTVKESGTIVDPGFLLGSPWWAYDFLYREFPRPVSISVVGDTLTYTLSTPGLNSRQINNFIVLQYGTY